MITTVIVLTHCFNFAPTFAESGEGSSDNSIVDVEPTPTDETDGEQNGNESEIVGKEEGFDDETITDIDEVVDDENDVPATTEPVEDEEYQLFNTFKLENEIEPLADNVSACNFVVSGGELGTDYQCNGVVLEIKRSTPLTIKTAGYDNTNYSTSINGGIRVLSGVSADLTFAGVNIVATANSGIQLLAGSKLHLTLADGSINFLNTTQTTLSGINAPEGTELTIDDSITNKDIYGNEVVPVNGVIGSDVTLSNGTQLKAGDSITGMDADKDIRGKLVVRGGQNSAGIGANANQNSGKITFNGGEVYSFAWGGQNTTLTTNSWPLEDTREAHADAGSGSSGAGVGGSYPGSATETIINGGFLDARASYHGAGIGSGWGSLSSGNITIRGGYILSRGYAHGNAFGQGCGGNANGKTFDISGGTLLPTSQSGRYDIGGTGGSVIISGGSVRVSGAGKFQSSDGKAYGDAAKTQEVFMITINLKAEGYSENIIEKWGLKINGVDYSYGAPSMLDDGNLYLWLPSSAKNQTVQVDVWVRDDDDNLVQIEPLYVEDAGGSGGSTLKRYIDFTFPQDYQSTLIKYYDGTAFAGFKISEVESTAPVGNFNKIPEGDATKGIWTSEAIPKLLDKDDALKFTYIDDNNNTGNTLPIDAGKYQLTMISTQYSSDKDFSESYWGHRASGNAEIKPVDSSTTVTVKRDADLLADKKIVIEADIVSAESMKIPSGTLNIAKTCGFPTGKVQLYIDGQKLGDVIDLNTVTRASNPIVSHVASDASDDGRNHTIVTYEYTPSENDAWLLEPKPDNKHKVSAAYTPDKNYNASKNETDVEAIIEPIDNDKFAVKVSDKVNTGLLVDTDGKVGGKDKLDETVLTLKYDSTGNYYYVEIDVDTLSKADIKYSIANSNIGEIIEIKDTDGQATKARVKVIGCGETKITIKQDDTGAYYGAERSFILNVPLYSSLAPEPAVSKSAINLDYPDKAAGAGDTIRYTIEATNKRIGSKWAKVVIYDKLNDNLEILTNSITITNKDGKVSKVPASAYDATTRTLKADLSSVIKSGVIIGGEKYYITFDAKVKDDYDPAVDGTITNIANANGFGPGNATDAPITDPNPDDIIDNPDDYYKVDDYDKPTGKEPTNPDDPTTGGTPSNPSVPEPIIPENPTNADIKLTKTADNITTPSGNSKVGDEVEYTITISNTKRGSVWYDAFIIDNLPEGLELDSEKPIIVVDTKGQETEIYNNTTVYNDIYNDLEKRLALAVGDIYGGESASVIFTAIIQEEGELKNVAKAAGLTPDEKQEEKKNDPNVPIDQKDKPGNPNPNNPGEPYNPTTDPKLDDIDLVVESKPSYPNPKDDPNYGKGDGGNSNASDRTVPNTNDISSQRVAYICGFIAIIIIGMLACVYSIFKSRKC